MNRRNFMRWCAAGASGLALPALHADDDARAGSVFSLANTGIANRKVVVVGGGMAGASVAKYLRLWGEAGWMSPWWKRAQPMSPTS